MTSDFSGSAVAVFDNYWSTTLAFARSLGRRGVPIHCYGAGAGRWSRYCRRHSRCPPAENFEEFQHWLRARLRSGEITRIAPTTDLIAFHASALRDEFSPHVQRTIAPLTEIEDCLIKTRFASVCAAAGWPVLPTLAPDSIEGALDAASQLGYPLILKPKSHLVAGFAERGRLLRTEADLIRHYRRYAVAPGHEALAGIYPELSWPLLQRYVATARRCVYSVSGIKDANHGVVSACVSYKREQWPPDVGVSTLQFSYEDRRILEFGLEVVNRTLSRGIFEVEVVEDGGALYAIDLNPRAFGFLELDIARGSDLPWRWFQSTLESHTPERQQLSGAAFQARHWLLRVIKGMARNASATDAAPSETEKKDARRISVSMLGHRSDPVPMIISNLYLLRHPRSLLRAQLSATRRAS